MIARKGSEEGIGLQGRKESAKGRIARKEGF
jgi:hypothetical protein